MKKVQLFKNTTILALQEDINTWLNANHSVEIIHSNLSTYTSAEEGEEAQLVFYILYLDNPQAEQLPLKKMEEPLKDNTAEIAKETVEETQATDAPLAN